MKYILSLLTIALFCAAATVSAAVTYERVYSNSMFDVLAKQYDNSNDEGTAGQYFKILITDGPVTLYITDLFNNQYTFIQNEALTAQGMAVTEFGFSAVSGSNSSVRSDNFIMAEESPTSLYSHTTTQWVEGNGWTNVDYYRNGYSLGSFSTGDEVEISLSTQNDSASSNTPQHGRYISTFATRADGPLDIPIGSLYLNGTQVNFGIIAVDTSANQDGTLGTPLPGKLAIVLVSALFALGFWYIRRRKVVAA